MTTDTHGQQLRTLLEAALTSTAAPKDVANTVAEMIERQQAALKANNDKLLRQLKAAQSKPTPDAPPTDTTPKKGILEQIDEAFAKLSADMNAAFDDIEAKHAAQKADEAARRDTAKPTHIAYERGVSPVEYRRLKERAEELGVPLVMKGTEAEGEARRAAERTPARDAWEHMRNRARDAGKVPQIAFEDRLYVSRDEIDRLGPIRAQRMAEAQGKRLVAYRSVADLPPEVAAVHDGIVREGGS